MKELVSIIVPINKVEAYISVCIESLLKQTYKNIEIILVINEKQDNSLKICEYYKKQDKKIRVIKVKNDSNKNLKNVGIAEAKGKYITFVDGGDTVEKTYVEYMMKLMVNEKADAVFTTYYLKGTKPKMAGFYDVYDSSEIMNKYMKMNFKSHFYAKLYKKELFNDIEYPSVKCYDDFMIGYKLFAKIKTLVNSEVPNYCLNPNKQKVKDRINDYDRMKKIGACFDMLTFIEENYEPLVDECKCKLCFEALDLFAYIKDKDYRKQLYSYIKLYRKYAMMDDKIPVRRKMLCARSLFGYHIMKLNFDMDDILNKPV